MKKIYNFLKSMKFGMILLIIIAALCLIATFTGRDEIYSKWYFIVLFVLLALNLTFCSVVRVVNLGKVKQGLLLRASKADSVLEVKDADAWLKSNHFKPVGEAYLKNAPGFWGTFLTHAAMLLMTVACFCIFALAEKQDYRLYLNEPVTLDDGTTICATAFSTKDENGSVEYKSTISAVLPDGSTKEGDIRVNYPMKVGKYKLYQQSFFTAAKVGMLTSGSGKEETTMLDEPGLFLTLDGENGIYYSQLFGNVIEEENGEIKVSGSSELINPAYEVMVVENGERSRGLVYPGDALMVDGVMYTFYDPEVCPGVRVKSQPEWTLALLYLSFAVMTAGLFLCFFVIPQAAYRKDEGLAIVGTKDISDKIDEYKNDLEV